MPPERSKGMKTITVSLEPRQIEALDEICRQTRVNRSVLIRDGVDVIIARHEKPPGGSDTAQKRSQG